MSKYESAGKGPAVATNVIRRKLASMTSEPLPARIHTVVVGAQGQVLDQKVGPYTERELEAILLKFAAKSG